MARCLGPNKSEHTAACGRSQTQGQRGCTSRRDCSAGPIWKRLEPPSTARVQSSSATHVPTCSRTTMMPWRHIDRTRPGTFVHITPDAVTYITRRAHDIPSGLSVPTPRQTFQAHTNRFALGMARPVPVRRADTAWPLGGASAGRSCLHRCHRKTWTHQWHPWRTVRGLHSLRFVCTRTCLASATTSLRSHPQPGAAPGQVAHRLTTPYARSASPMAMSHGGDLSSS